MNRKPVDLPRVKSALTALDRLAAEHPEAFAGRSEQDWTRILTTEEQTMSEPITGTVRQGRPSAEHEHEHEPSTQVAVRLPVSLLASIDTWITAYREKHPGIALTRSDGIRALIARALPQHRKASSRCRRSPGRLEVAP